MSQSWDLPGMYVGTRESQDIQTRGWGGGGGRGVQVPPGMYLGTRESQDTQTRGGSISWDLAPMYLELLYYTMLLGIR